MERRQIDLKRAIAQFTNGNFEQAVLAFSRWHEEHESLMRPNEAFILHEYWAASLERLGKTKEALSHARQMITSNEASHKGYLRLGKLLRLLNDTNAALQIYQVGLRRAKSGVNDIAAQIRAVEAARAAVKLASLDPFMLLPADLFERILELVEAADPAALKRLPLLSQDAALHCRRYLSRPSGTLCIVETLTKTKVLENLMGHEACQSLIITHPNLLVLFKFRERCKVFRRVELRGSFPSIPSLQEFIDEPLFPNLEHLVLNQVSLRSADLLLLSHGLELKSITIQNSQIPQAFTELDSFKNLFQRPVSVRITDNNWVGKKAPYFSPACPLERQNIRSFHWDDFFFPAITSALPAVEDLGVNHSFLDQDEAAIEDILDSNRIRSLKIISDHTSTISLVKLSNVGRFRNLRRLHLKGLVISEQSNQIMRLELNLAEHLFIEQVHPVPKIGHWSLPRLKTLSLSGCSMMAISQLPLKLGIEEILIRRQGMFMPPDCFKRLSEEFRNRRLRILGVTDAHHFYQSNGLVQISAIANENPFGHIFISDKEIAQRISHLWPS